MAAINISTLKEIELTRQLKNIQIKEQQMEHERRQIESSKESLAKREASIQRVEVDFTTANSAFNLK